MKRITSIATLLTVLVTVQPMVAQPKLIFDNDGTELLLNTYWNGDALTLEHLDSLTRMAAGTGVGIYSICSGSDNVCYPRATANFMATTTVGVFRTAATLPYTTTCALATTI